uniref:Ig-like domain-containing protein n=1 Tax=Oryzias latipes TaxID=8090 RepID=A0A3P9M389_ORYLA
MQVQQLVIVWSFKFLLAGAETPPITYPFIETCAAEGSTVLLPCSFTPSTKAIGAEGKDPRKIVRVLWCRRHPICHGTNPSVFDSEAPDTDSRFQYLGDKKGICTLQITNIQLEDAATYRFRMEAEDPAGHFTNRTGVTVRVEENPLMRVTGSNGSEVRGQTVSLQCTTSSCTFHGVSITWLKDDHALPETGPTLHLGPLTAKDSGNYSCALGTKRRSGLFRLQVEADSAGGTSHVILAVVLAVLLVGIALIVLFFLIKRRRAAGRQSAVERQRRDAVLPSGNRGAAQRTDPNTEDVSYAAIHFKASNPSREVQLGADDVVYSAVVSRG